MKFVIGELFEQQDAKAKWSYLGFIFGTLIFFVLLGLIIFGYIRSEMITWPIVALLYGIIVFPTLLGLIVDRFIDPNKIAKAAVPKKSN